MKITIIYPPYSEEAPKNQPNIKEVAKNYGVYPSVTLGYVAAIMEKAGHKVQFIDANALEMSRDEVIKKIREFKPDLLAFTITTYLFHQTIDYISEVKKELEIPVLVGGVHMELYPKETMSYDAIDYAIQGEAEETLPVFLDAFESGKDLSKVKSLIYREKGKVKINPIAGIVEDLEESPNPARHLMPNEKYYSFISKRRNFTGLISSRGCPFRCVYCEQGSKKFRFRSAEKVVDEFQECYDEHGVREIDIFDSSFTINKKRVIDMCNELQNRKLDISWSVRSRVDCINKEMLDAMKKAGCTRVYYGIESGNSNILKTLRKETNLQKIRETIHATKKSGINSFGYFMIGCPGDTPKTIRQTINFAKSLPLDYAQFSKVSPLPGTEIYDKLLKPKLKEDYWSKYIQNKNYEKDLPRPDCNLSEKKIQSLVKQAYKEFYFRPSYILKALSKVRSANELKRNAKGAIDMLFAKK